LAGSDVFVDPPGGPPTRRFARPEAPGAEAAVGVASAPPARVAILSDQALVAEALEWLLTSSGEFAVDALHASPEAMLRAVLADAPRVVVVDTTLAGYAAALAAVNEVRARRIPVKVVVLIDQVDAHVVRFAMDRHVDGLVLKTGSSQQIIGVLKQVLAGHVVFPADWHAALEAREPDRAMRSLSRRQLEVLQLAAQGYPNEEIAARLMISVNTVKSHLRTIFVRIGARNRVEAARILARMAPPGQGRAPGPRGDGP
jgi:two-component system, NarL family, response regulator DesR